VGNNFDCDLAAWFDQVNEHCLRDKHFLDLIEHFNFPNIFAYKKYCKQGTLLLTREGKKLRSLLACIFIVMIYESCHSCVIKQLNHSSNFKLFETVLLKNKKFAAFFKQSGKATEFCVDTVRVSGTKKFQFTFPESYQPNTGTFKFVMEVLEMDNGVVVVVPVTFYVRGPEPTSPTDFSRVQQLNKSKPFYKKKSERELWTLVNYLMLHYNLDKLLEKLKIPQEKQEQLKGIFYSEFGGQSPFPS